MDCLERRMQSLIEELEAYKHRFTNLEGQNISLRSQVQQLQAQVSQCNCTNKYRIFRINTRGDYSFIL